MQVSPVLPWMQPGSGEVVSVVMSVEEEEGTGAEVHFIN